MDFSFIIINYQTPDITVDCLRSILKFCPQDNCEIIVIDNASGDESVAIIKKEFGEKIKLIANRENLGFAKANNQGAKMATGRYLFFLNSDTLLTDNPLEKLKIRFQENKIGIVAPQVLTADGLPQKSAYGSYPKIKDLILSKLKNKIDDNGNPKKDWVSGAALVIKKNVFDLIGGWDEKFFLYFEDVDICRRTKMAGYSIIVDSESSIIHLSGQSLKKNWQRRKHYYRSQDYYFLKHEGFLESTLLKIMRLPYELWLALSDKK
ncbi:MAG: glycosyltransferase family 2 protein [Patescibacteria group bacterium]